MPTNPSSLAFIVDSPLVAQFYLLLQHGVHIRRRVGCSVDVFLRQEIGATPEVINKIQSIILDGKAVDDINASLIHNGATLALSAAMPGLVGATLRRGGAYSSFRNAITYHELETPGASGEGLVRIKIFNLLMAELGPGLLQRGVIVQVSDLAAYLEEHKSVLPHGCSITLDGKPMDIGMISGDKTMAGNKEVFLTVAAGRTVT